MSANQNDFGATSLETNGQIGDQTGAGASIKQSIVGLLGNGVSVSGVALQGHGMPTKYTGIHTTQGIPLMLSGQADLVQVDLSENIATHPDPIKTILQFTYTQGRKLVLTTRSVTGGGIGVVPERTRGQVASMQVESRTEVLTRYGGDVTMNLNAWLRPEDAKRELSAKLAAQKRELEKALVKIGYETVMKSGVPIVDAIVNSNSMYGLKNRTGDPAARRFAQQVYSKSLFGALSRFKYPLPNLLAAAKKASAYKPGNVGVPSILILPHGLPAMSDYVVPEKMKFNLSGINYNDHETVNLSVSDVYTDPSTNIKIMAHIPPINTYYGTNAPTSDQSLLSRNVGIISAIPVNRTDMDEQRTKSVYIYNLLTGNYEEVSPPRTESGTMPRDFVRWPQPDQWTGDLHTESQQYQTDMNEAEHHIDKLCGVKGPLVPSLRKVGSTILGEDTSRRRGIFYLMAAITDVFGRGEADADQARRAEGGKKPETVVNLALAVCAVLHYTATASGQHVGATKELFDYLVLYKRICRSSNEVERSIKEIKETIRYRIQLIVARLAVVEFGEQCQKGARTIHAPVKMAKMTASDTLTGAYYEPAGLTSDNVKKFLAPFKVSAGDPDVPQGRQRRASGSPDEQGEGAQPVAPAEDVEEQAGEEAGTPVHDNKKCYGFRLTVLKMGAGILACNSPEENGRLVCALPSCDCYSTQEDMEIRTRVYMGAAVLNPSNVLLMHDICFEGVVFDGVFNSIEEAQEAASRKYTVDHFPGNPGDTCTTYISPNGDVNSYGTTCMGWMDSEEGFPIVNGMQVYTDNEDRGPSKIQKYTESLIQAGATARH